MTIQSASLLNSLNSRCPFIKSLFTAAPSFVSYVSLKNTFYCKLQVVRLKTFSFNMQITKCLLYVFSFLIFVRWRLDQVGVDSRRREWGIFADRLKKFRFEYMRCE